MMIRRTVNNVAALLIVAAPFALILWVVTG
jgi:hypothetical protein